MDKNLSFPDEPERRKLLKAYGVLNDHRDAQLEGIVEIAATVCDSSIALISLSDGERQFFKSRHGTEATEIPRRGSFCQKVNDKKGILVVEDATTDNRFAELDLVTEKPFVRFYAGAPLMSPEGIPLGTLCVLDTTPKTLDPKSCHTLELLADQVMKAFELNKQAISNLDDDLKVLHEGQTMKHLYEQSKDALMILDPPTWKFTSCNPAALELFSVPDFKTFKELGPWNVSPEKQPDGQLSSEKAKALILKTLEDGATFFEWTHRSLDGREIPCNISLSKIQEKDRFYIHAVVRDVSSQKKLEKQLLESYDRLDLALDGAGLGIWDWNVRTNEVTFDRRWAEMIGLNLDEISMELSTWESRVHPDDLQACYQDIQDYMSGKTDRYENIHRMRHKDGHWVSILDRGRYSGWDEEGNPVRFTGTHFDISERVEHEKERSLVLEKNKIGIWKYNLMDQSLEWDDSMYQLYGMDPKDFSGAYDAWTSSLHPDDREQAEKDLQNAIDGMKPFDTIFAIQTPKNETRHIHARAIVERDASGKAITMIGVNSDVSREQEALQAAKDASRVKSEFLANMSHEIRTPMNGVLGMLFNLKDTQLDINQKEMLEVIEKSSKNLLNILNDILDLSKIESGKLQLEQMTFDLEADLKGIIKLMRPSAESKENILTLELEEPFQNLLKGDSLRIHQVLTNLLSNAIKFTKRGRIVVRCQTSKQDDGSIELTISVEDTGIGIEKSVQNRLFQAFQQGDTSITRRFGGTGLGLTICSSLAKLMGGSVNFKSEENQGSIFFFNARLKKGIPSDLKPKDLQSEPLQKNLDLSHRIILAEDNKTNQLVGSMIMKKLGIPCDIANNGREVLEMISKKGIGHYTLVLMDLQMPELDGLETTKLIFQQYGAKSPKIIALTANAFDRDRQQCLEVGMKGFLSKPIEVDQLIKFLSKPS